VEADLGSDAGVRRAVDGQDLVVGAVPGFMGFSTVRRVLEAGKDIVDISFFDEDPFELDALAKKSGRIAVVDCGVAPGCSNLIAGRLQARLGKLDSFLCYVGGLPSVRLWPYEYRAVFSPIDVIEEYTRPARLVERGEVVVRPALSEPELIDFAGVGTLEAFNTDGLRTLLRTIGAPNLKEKTLRFPGHAEKMRVLREAGFFDETAIRVDGADVKPRAVTEALLRKAWTLPAGDDEFTVLRVVVAGTKGHVKRRIVWDLYDTTDPASRATSMARTTGFPCAIVARLLAEGSFKRPGVHPPEVLGKDEELTGRILTELKRRGVSVERHER
jgi:saccharopine dehydrogenase-like NADP-dependent oxidoreductase